MTKSLSRDRASSRSSAAPRAHPADQTIARFFSALTRIAPDLPKTARVDKRSKGKMK